MSTRILLWLVLLGLCGTCSDASRDRRIDKQLDTFKDYVKDEISYLKEDITTLFDSLKTITTGDNSLSIARIAEQLDEKYGRLFHAFEAEKILDRKSNEQITSIKDSITDLYKLIASNKNEISEELSVLKQSVFIDYCTQNRGVQNIYVNAISSSVPVYCDRNADDEVWTTFMRRESGQVLFNRSWAEYKTGFGTADGEFWSGNELLHQLTASKTMHLRIDMADFDGNKAFAQYETFQIGSEGDKYRLTVDGYSGNAGNSLSDHKGMMFSTFDSDNDMWSSNCAQRYSAGWWFGDCFHSNLNGVYHNHGDISKWDGIIWYTWTGGNKALKFVEMKVR